MIDSDLRRLVPQGLFRGNGSVRSMEPFVCRNAAYRGDEQTGVDDLSLKTGIMVFIFCISLFGASRSNGALTDI